MSFSYEYRNWVVYGGNNHPTVFRTPEAAYSYAKEIGGVVHPEALYNIKTGPVPTVGKMVYREKINSERGE